MIKVHFFKSELVAYTFADSHPLYNSVKRGWRRKGTKRDYGYWVGYGARP